MGEKKIAITILVIFFMILVIVPSLLTGCHGAARDLGGDLTVELQPNQKLEEITWKEDSLWILTRPMREDENAETHVFYEDSEWHVWEGTVTIIEKEEDQHDSSR